jgi:hypothetical protein
MLKLNFFKGVPRRSADITNMANARQYSPIFANINIENHAVWTGKTLAL